MQIQIKQWKPLMKLMVPAYNIVSQLQILFYNHIC